jgi:hypothetical protein
VRAVAAAVVTAELVVVAGEPALRLLARLRVGRLIDRRGVEGRRDERFAIGFLLRKGG